MKDIQEGNEVRLPTGKGKLSKLLTLQEEQSFRNRIFDVAAHGELITHKLVSEMADKFLSELFNENPTRYFGPLKKDGKYFTQRWVHIFCERHGIITLINEGRKFKDLSKSFKCDLCEFKSAFKNCLVKHRKHVHFQY